MCDRIPPRVLPLYEQVKRSRSVISPIPIVIPNLHTEMYIIDISTRLTGKTFPSYWSPRQSLLHVMHAETTYNDTLLYLEQQSVKYIGRPEQKMPTVL